MVMDSFVPRSPERLDGDPRIEDMSELVTDGWISELTGMGIVGKDKNESSTFVRRARRHHEVLDAMYRQDALAARIIDVLVDDSLRQGFRIVFKGDDEQDIDPEQVNDINSRVNKWGKSKGIKLGVNVGNHLKQSRTYGGSVLVMGANDGQDSLMPLNPDRVQEFTFLKPLDRFQLSASGLLVTDPRSDNFGMPAWYHLHSIFGSFELVTSALLDERLSQSIGIVEPTEELPTTQAEAFPKDTGQTFGEGKPSLNNVTVHTSRLVRTDGTILSDRSRLNNDGWGDSILERCWEPLRNWNTAMNSMGTLVHDFSQGVYGIKGLAEIIKAGKQGLLKKRWQLMDVAKSVVNATLIDADGETYERKTTNVTGLPELIDRFGIHLGASAGMPITKILGVSPGGFGTGENEDNDWDDVTQSFQEETVGPVLVEVLTVLFMTPEFNDVPENWGVEFFPLKQVSNQEQAQVMKDVATADSVYVQLGVLTPDEVAQARFGGEKFSLDTQLDEETRTAAAETMTPEEEAEALKANEEAAAAGETEPAANQPPEGEDVPTVSEPGGDEPISDTTPEEAADPGTAFNGAQVQALSAIVLQVVNNEIPFESAVQLIAISFPVDEEAARRLLQPAKDMQAEVEAETEANKEEMPDEMQANMPGGPPPPGAGDENTGHEDDENTDHEDDEEEDGGPPTPP